MEEDSEENGSFEDGLLIVGIDFPDYSDINALLEIAGRNQVHFACCAIFHPRSSRGEDSQWNFNSLVTRSDMTVDRSDWRANIVGLASPWIFPSADSNSGIMSTNAKFRLECSYAVHLGLQALLLPSFVTDLEVGKHAVTVAASRISAELGPSIIPPLMSSSSSVSNSSNGLQLWITIPLYYDDRKTSPRRLCRGWPIWNQLRSSCDHHSSLFCALDLTGIGNFGDDLLAQATSTELSIVKWLGEPVKALIISTRQFMQSCNRKGKLVVSLPPYLKYILSKFTHQPVQVIIRGKNRHDRKPDNLRAYVASVEKLWANHAKPITLYHGFCMNYRDSLRAPLQPLSVHLDSETYTVMEQDPVKYTQYYKALKRALQDCCTRIGISRTLSGRKGSNQKRKFNSNQFEGAVQGWINANTKSACHNIPPSPDNRPMVLVVGPGRGPLIKAALRAATALDIGINVIAIEKNPNAIVTLRNRALLENWNNPQSSVTIYCADARTWKPEDHGLPQVDVVVSELLGSWGDNECSPECLDIIMKNCVKPITGVCIPRSYTSYIAPLASSKLWNLAKCMTLDLVGGLHTPYVVELFNKYVTNNAKPLFQFIHDHQESSNYNQRFGSVSFVLNDSDGRVDKDGITIYGFAGYFDCQLYDKVSFSTVPETFSEGMFSWFPMYIPIERPMFVPYDYSIDAKVWRRVSSSKMWYEWSVSLASPSGDEIAQTPIHNVIGTYSSVSL